MFVPPGVGDTYSPHHAAVTAVCLSRDRRPSERRSQEDQQQAEESSRSSAAPRSRSMSFPTPLLSGSLGFFLGCMFLLACMKALQLTGRMSKDNTGIGFTVVIMSAISMWLLWSMAWFHQWHPLITPEFP